MGTSNTMCTCPVMQIYYSVFMTVMEQHTGLLLSLYYGLTSFYMFLCAPFSSIYIMWYLTLQEEPEYKRCPGDESKLQWEFSFMV